MRVLFAGTPEIAVPTLRTLFDLHDVCGVLTNPARKVGRSSQPVDPPVHRAAVELGLPILQPERLLRDARDQIRRLAPETMVVFAYGHIFGPKFLALFPHGSINVHTSLLPRHRGPAPIQAALLAGDSHTGVSVQKVALGVDTGEILAQRVIALSGGETALDLIPVLAQLGSSLTVDVLHDYSTRSGTPQDDGVATYSRLVKKGDGKIDWSLPARTIYNMYRAYTPWPGIETRYADLQLRILECRPEAGSEPARPPGAVFGVDKRAGLLVQTGDGVLAVQRLQLQARKAVDFRSFLNGNRDILDSVLGE